MQMSHIPLYGILQQKFLSNQEIFFHLDFYQTKFCDMFEPRYILPILY